MDSCNLFLGRDRVGELCWEQGRDRTKLFGSCPLEEGWIYRVAIKMESRTEALGVMLPENGRFVIRREILSLEKPQIAFIDRSRPGEAHLPGLPLAFSAFSVDREIPGLLSADWMDERFFLYLWQPGTACDCSPFFCLSRIIEAGGRLYGAFRKAKGIFQPIEREEPQK